MINPFGKIENWEALDAAMTHMEKSSDNIQALRKILMPLLEEESEKPDSEKDCLYVEDRLNDIHIALASIQTMILMTIETVSRHVVSVREHDEQVAAMQHPPEDQLAFDSMANVTPLHPVKGPGRGEMN